MNVYKNFKPGDSVDSHSLVTSIGAFDGVHLGHKALFEEAFKVSAGEFQIVTFNQIPKVFFNSSLDPLLDQEERTKMFEQLNPKNIVFLDFKSVNTMDASDFCDFLKNNLQTEKLVIGKDFKFGNQRVGDVNTLIGYFGVDNVILLDDFLIDAEKVSTTKIRLSYAQGDIKQAEKLLGRKISYKGTVSKGKQLGTSIGVPTANIAIKENVQMPRFGVYAVNVYLDNKTYLGCLNIGNNPTIDDDIAIKTEIHILDFNDNIYDQELSFELIDFIRDEHKFESLDALKAQIYEDIEKIKNNF